MSMVLCDCCMNLIDSDEDPDCFVGDRIWCEACRENNMTEEEIEQR
jgi:hypothetical protein